MDLQEKLDKLQDEIVEKINLIAIHKGELKDLLKLEKGYLKLIEKAKALEQK